MLTKQPVSTPIAFQWTEVVKNFQFNTLHLLFSKILSLSFIDILEHLHLICCKHFVFPRVHFLSPVNSETLKKVKCVLGARISTYKKKTTSEAVGPKCTNDLSKKNKFLCQSESTQKLYIR